MKLQKTLLCCIILGLSLGINAQDADYDQIEKTCNDYLDGFYLGDTIKIKQCLSESLYKIGYIKNKEVNDYIFEGQMTYQDAIKYSKHVLDRKAFVSEKAPRKVEVLDVMNFIAVAKITAWWGVDYVLLINEDNGWIIQEVLWEGPLIR